MNFFFLLITSLIFSLSVFSQQKNYNEEISSEYPTFRYVGASYSTIFGSMAIWQGLTVLNKDKPKTHDHLAIATIAIGSGRLYDGVRGLFVMEKGERMAKLGEIKTKSELENVSSHAYRMRLYRSFLIASNSILFFKLYSKGDKEYKPYIYPAVIMGGISVFNLIRLSPEEKVHKASKDFDVAILPVNKGTAVQLSFTF